MPKDCIDPKKVPCDKARAYLAKKGLLCGVKKDSPQPKKKPFLTAFFDEWFG
jgi:hypothetical protein